MQPLALLKWHSAQILQAVAFLERGTTQIYEEELAQSLALLERQPTLSHESKLLQPLALLECQPTQIHEAVAASRPRSNPRSS